MHGCKRRFVLLTLLLAGCAEAPSAPPQPAPTPAPASAFDVKCTGTIRGAVTWDGTLPSVAPFKVFGLPGNYPVDLRPEQPNPNVPRIDSTTLAMQSVTVFLRQVDPAKSRLWDHGSPSVEQVGRRLVIKQGDSAGNVGWVLAGASVEMVNRDVHFHMLRGRGDAFFSLPFPDPNVPVKRHFDKRGVVELSSGSFFFWMRGYLHVADHPYYARTDMAGNFVLDKVPAGTYELVCWQPSWQVAGRNRDPETGLIIQVDFKAPVERVATLTVTAGATTRADFAWSLRDFD